MKGVLQAERKNPRWRHMREAGRNEGHRRGQYGGDSKWIPTVGNNMETVLRRLTYLYN